MPFLETNDCRFYYQQKGEGADVVLVHAFTSNTAVWLFTNTVDRLAKQYRVTAYDLRGHGSSGVTPRGYRSDEMASDFFAIHEALQLDPCAIVGHSFGGVIAVQAAVQRPDLVRGIIFSDTYFPGLRHLEPEMGQSEPWAELREQMHACDIEIGETVDFHTLFVRVSGMTEDQKQILMEQMGPVSASWISTLGSLAQTSAGRDAFEEAGLSADRIASIQCPVFALYDEFSPFHKTREFLENSIANIDSAIVPGARHLAPLQSTEDFLRLVEEGLDQILMEPDLGNGSRTTG